MGERSRRTFAPLLALLLALPAAACAAARGEEGDRGPRFPGDGADPGPRFVDDGSQGGDNGGKPAKAPKHRKEKPPREPEKPEGKKGSFLKVHGNLDLTFWYPYTRGDVAMDGGTAATTGGPHAESFSLDIDLLFDRFIVTHGINTTFLPSDLALRTSGLVSTTRSQYGSWELAAGPKLLEVKEEASDAAAAVDSPKRKPRSSASLFRLDSFVGIRAHRFSDQDKVLGFLPDSRSSFGWKDPIAGLRAEWVPSPDFAFRVRGDRKFSGTGSDCAWRASAAVVFFASSRASLAVGWAVSHVRYDTGRPPFEDRYALDLSGPFAAFEFRF